MIDLHDWTRPNGLGVRMSLENAGRDYRIILANISAVAALPFGQTAATTAKT